MAFAAEKILPEDLCIRRCTNVLCMNLRVPVYRTGLTMVMSTSPIFIREQATFDRLVIEHVIPRALQSEHVAFLSHYFQARSLRRMLRLRLAFGCRSSIVFEQSAGEAYGNISANGVRFGLCQALFRHR